ncbi:MAG: hypothetical protein F7C09_04075 [Aeropyrum sp.]|nr:hypothetical protein [Aeropyrum sp.]
MSASLFKAGLRSARRRLLEGLSLTVIVWLSVSLLGVSLVITSNMENHVSSQIRNRIGDVIVLGAFPEDSIDSLGDLRGVERVEAYKVLPASSLQTEEEEFLVGLVSTAYWDSVKVKDLEGMQPKGEDEIILYWALSGAPLEELKDLLGTSVRLIAFSLDGEPIIIEADVVGVSWGYEWLAGRRVAVVVSEEVMDRLTGGMYTMVAIFAENPEEAELESIAEAVVERLEMGGGVVVSYSVMRPDENPIVVLLKGAHSIFTVPSAALYVLLFILPAAAGTAMAVRESRMVAVLRAQGAGAREVGVLFLTPWLVWGVLGSALGVLTVLLASEAVYTSIFVGDAEIARLLYESYGFVVPRSVLAQVSGLALAGVVLGGLAPIGIMMRLDIVGALRSAELPIQLVPPRLTLPTPLSLLSGFRDALSRPWKIVGLALALAVVWGIAGSMSALSAGVDEIIYTYSERMPPDLFISVESITFTPPSSVASVLEEAVISAAGEYVEGYTIISSEEYIDALGLNEFFTLVTYTHGNPETAFPLEEGRYPESGGEAVISRSLASLLGVGVGDSISLNLEGRSVVITITGVSYSRLANGFYALVTPNFYAEHAGTPGLLSATAHIDLVEGVDSESIGGDIREALKEYGFVSVLEVITREELVDAFNVLSILLSGILGGILVLASLAAGISVASMIAVDSSTRSKENAVLIALGTPKRWIVGGYLIGLTIAVAASALPAYILATLISRLVASRSALAVGYIEPVLDPRTVLAPDNLMVALAVGVISGVIAIWIQLRRLNVAQELRE